MISNALYRPALQAQPAKLLAPTNHVQFGAQADLEQDFKNLAHRLLAMPLDDAAEAIQVVLDAEVRDPIDRSRIVWAGDLLFQNFRERPDLLEALDTAIQRALGIRSDRPALSLDRLVDELLTLEDAAAKDRLQEVISGWADGAPRENTIFLITHMLGLQKRLTQFAPQLVETLDDKFIEYLIQ